MSELDEATKPKTIRKPQGVAPEPAVVAAPEPVKPAPTRTKAPKIERDPTAPILETDDLLALADMDPNEIAALMDASVGRSSFDVGDKVTGTVTRIARDTVFVDVGAKSEGQLDSAELPAVEVGQEIEAYVIYKGEQGIDLSTTLSGAAASEHIEEALASGVPVEGKVVNRNPGGFEVRIGSVRAFCPRSMISRLPEGFDQDAYVGQTLPFRIIETGDKVVVSRRALQEEEAAVKAEELWKTIAEGDEFRGIVRNVTDFGFFVDIGGVDGLVPKREISWAGNVDPRTAVAKGAAVEVRVLSVDHATKRISLSAKSLDDDPWTMVGSDYAAGGVYEGTVVSTAEFGAFVELAEGLQGLIHISKLPGGLPEKGSSITVRILDVDHDRRRLALAPSTGEVSDALATEEATGTVVEVMRNGVVVQLEDGRSGWLPAGEVDLPPGTMLAQRFRRGKSVTARIAGVTKGKVNLSLKSAEQKNWRKHMTKNKDAGGFGTMAALLGDLKLK